MVIKEFLKDVNHENCIALWQLCKKFLPERVDEVSY